ncbi:ATP-binding protein [Shimia sp. SDUM112013]|uniref:ATP-binding protein n=1 Tax=Shimia sp. SDUM112013 TaxID=3136160 RepID=UPI0032EF5CCE
MTSLTSTFAIELDGTPQAVRSALADVRKRLEGSDMSSEMQGRVEIVLAEILNNIVEHALAEVENGKISLRFERSGSECAVRIEDNGSAMPDSTLSRTRLPELETEFHDLPEGGFGWALVKMLARDVRYVRLSGKNRLELVLSSVPEAG